MSPAILGISVFTDCLLQGRPTPLDDIAASFMGGDTFSQH